MKTWIPASAGMTDEQLQTIFQIVPVRVKQKTPGGFADESQVRPVAKPPGVKDPTKQINQDRRQARRPLTGRRAGRVQHRPEWRRAAAGDRAVCQNGSKQ